VRRSGRGGGKDGGAPEWDEARRNATRRVAALSTGGAADSPPRHMGWRRRGGQRNKEQDAQKFEIFRIVHPLYEKYFDQRFRPMVRKAPCGLRAATSQDRFWISAPPQRPPDQKTSPTAHMGLLLPAHLERDQQEGWV